MDDIEFSAEWNVGKNPVKIEKEKIMLKNFSRQIKFVQTMVNYTQHKIEKKESE